MRRIVTGIAAAMRSVGRDAISTYLNQGGRSLFALAESEEVRAEWGTFRLVSE
jgi:hypothetical protein